MAMNGDTLGLAMLAAVDVYIATVPDPKGDNLSREDIFKEMGKEIVKHIQSFGVVATTVPALGLVAPTGGGPVTGSASGTGGVS